MSYTLIGETAQKAKKEHRCTWCGQQIPVGESYVRRRGVFEGEPQVDKFHPECDERSAEICAEEGGQFEFSPFENDRPSTSDAAVKSSRT